MDHLNCYIEFEFSKEKYFNDLLSVFEKLKESKNNTKPKEDNNDIGFEGAYIDTEENLQHLMVFLFGPKFNLAELTLDDDKKVIDLTPYLHECKTEGQLEARPFCTSSLFH